jgi:hypothetical protein
MVSSSYVALVISPVLVSFLQLTAWSVSPKALLIPIVLALLLPVIAVPGVTASSSYLPFPGALFVTQPFS